MTEQSTIVKEFESHVESFNENYTKFSNDNVKAAGTNF